MQRVVLLTLGACLVGFHSYAHENDPYTHRAQDLRDSLPVLDREVNEALKELVSSWKKGEDEWQFVMAVYRRLGGVRINDRLQRWALRSPEVDRIEFKRRESIISDFPRYAARFTTVFNVSPIINVNDVYIGADKIGHFFSQGRKIYGRYRRFGEESLAMRRSIFTERAIFGSLTTGIYSNADLVANYEGYRFYRSLLNDDVISGKSAILRWEEGRLVIQRSFTWSDHVNPFWDESLNPNIYAKALVPHVEKRLLALCEHFTLKPERYIVPNVDELLERYRVAGVRPNPALVPARFLETNCPDLSTTYEN